MKAKNIIEFLNVVVDDFNNFLEFSNEEEINSFTDEASSVELYVVTIKIFAQNHNL